MSTDVDAPVTRSRRYVWLAALLVLGLLGGLFAVNRMGAFGSDTPAGAADGPQDFHALLTAKTVAVLEQLPAEAHHHGDVDAVTGDSTMICGVRIFGFGPPDADTVAEVAQVYGYHMCAVARPGVDWLASEKLTGPLVLTLAADPPAVHTVKIGDGYQERVRRLFPEKFHAEVSNENLTREGMQELIRRYREAAKA